ncbi:MAG: S8 family serine peptidase [Desulfuromonadaceae bacterium]|jgi:thermitase
MKGWSWLFGALLFPMLLATGNAWAEKPVRVPGELLVQFEVGLPKAAMAGEMQRHGASVVESLPRIRVHRLKVNEANREQVKAALSHNPHVTFVEDNFIAFSSYIPNDTSFANQWHLPKISAPEGWDISTGSSLVPIAIIDSGVDSSHPDLAGKLISGYNFLGGNTDTSDVLGHGTAVAGSAAASSNNSLGVAGVAWDNPIMPLVVLDASDYASYYNIASAIIYAVDNGAKVINISIGGSSSSSTLQYAVDYAWNNGAVIFASAMNYGTSTPYYPAACNHVLAVSATDKNDAKASFSNYGSWIDIAAPGYYIYTTNRGGGYGYWNGTSFSSPIAAGLAGLIWSVNPLLTNEEVVNLLQNNADDLGAAGFDELFGYGRINVLASLQAAQEFVPVPDSTSPTVTLTSPGDSSTISGTLTINAVASDDSEVAKVELYVNNQLLATDVSPAYSFNWDTLTVAEGWYVLQAKAYDTSGNVGQSESVQVLVSNPVDNQAPVATIISPLPGESSKKLFKITATATDNVGVSQLDLFIDGSLVQSVAGDLVSYTWVVRKASAGAHTISVKAYDAVGQVGTDSITVYR